MIRTVVALVRRLLSSTERLPKLPPAWRRIAVPLVVLALGYFAAQLILPRGVPVEALVPGLVIGGLSSFTAMGLVLIYRTSRVINFAQANMGGVVATVVVLLVAIHHWNYWLAVLVGIGAAVTVGALVESGLLRRLREAPRLIVTVATIGIAQLFEALTGFLPQWMGSSRKSLALVPIHVPWRVNANLGTLLLNGDYFFAILVIPVVLLILVWYFKRTDNGIGARAAADSTERAQLLGIPVRRLVVITWMAASVLSTLGALLQAGVNGYQPTALAGPEGIVGPLVAAVIAGFDSLPIAFLASLAIGVLQQAVFWSYRQSSDTDLIMFVLVLVALMFHRRSAARVGGEDLGEFAALRSTRPLAEQVARLPEVRILRAGGMVALLLLGSLLPLMLNDSQVTFFAFVGIFMIVAISLVILTGWAGQVSLGQFGLVGLGAGVSGWLITSYHASVLLSLVASTLMGIAAALVIGIPALRIRGIYLAAVTLAFAVPASTFFLSSLHFPSFAPTLVTPPLLFGRYDLSQPRDFYYFCLLFVIVAFGVARYFRNSRIGRAAIAVRDNERMAAAVSVSATRVRLIAFGLSGALSGIAGSLFLLASRGIPFGGFAPVLSLEAFTMVVVGGMGSLWGAILGALYVYLAQYFLGATSLLLVTGGGVVAVLSLAPGGFADLAYRLRDRLLRTVLRLHHLSPNLVYSRPEGEEATSYTLKGLFATISAAPARVRRTVSPRARLERGKPHADGSSAHLTCEGLHTGYGHLPVLFGVDMEVKRREILALLGTNGAGKSTILRVVAGLLPAWHGRVLFEGEDVTRLTPADRVARGIVMVPGGRGVFGSLSVRDNLRLASWIPRRRKDKPFVADTTARIFELFPVLEQRLGQQASLLSGGERQMLTIAMALLCGPRFLMVDELSLGLAPSVVSTLLEVLRSLNEDGITVMIVEQSINIATAVAPKAIFLEKGEARFSGETAELASNENLIRSVFLGPSDSARSASEPPLADRSDPKVTPHVVLETRGLRKTYGGLCAIDNVDLYLNEGEILGVIGANGAGKTTLFDIVSGFVGPDVGQILYQGIDITRMSSSTRAGLGLGRTFQDLRLTPSLTVAEVLAVAFERHIAVREPVAAVLGLAASLRSETRVRDSVEDLIESFNLHRFANSFISELSTGTRRVVELACATAHNPQVLILDEPSSGLAQPEAEAMIPLLKDMQSRNHMTIAIIEHDIPMIKELADEIACMHLGRIIARGPSHTVLSESAVITSYLGLDSVSIERSNGGRVSQVVSREGAL